MVSASWPTSRNSGGPEGTIGSSWWPSWATATSWSCNSRKGRRTPRSNSTEKTASSPKNVRMLMFRMRDSRTNWSSWIAAANSV